MFELEAPCRLSQSRLWELTTDFYERQGRSAFDLGTVPSRISCNAFIADSYAQVIAGYLRDVGQDRSGRYGEDTIVTIVEIGSGAGHFGFLLTRALIDAIAAYGIPSGGARFRYLMTDVAKSNVVAWTKNSKIAPLIASGHMDVAVLDVSAPEGARSEVSGKTLADTLKGGPVVLIGNYLFDSLINDAFRVESGKLFEVHVGLDLREPVNDVIGSSELFKNMHFRQSLLPIAWPYYPESEFDSILKSYEADLKEATFLFPMVALRCIDKLRRLANGDLLLLLSDKAKSSSDQLEGNKSLTLYLTGTFSSMVNFDAMARWFLAEGGSVKKPDVAKQHFDTYALVLGGVGHSGETEAAFDRHVRGFGPASYWSIARELINSVPRLPPRAILALLACSRFDPYLLVKLEAAVLDAIDAADASERVQLLYAVEQARTKVFPDARDMSFTLGRLFQRLGKPEKALDCYCDSIATYGERSETLHNIALCHADLGSQTESLDCFRRAVQLKGQDVSSQKSG